MQSGPYERLAALGISLAPPRAPVANFLPAVREGRLLFVSGQGPVTPQGHRFTGKVGAGVTVEEAYVHARLTTINVISILHDTLGSLDRVERIVKVLGFVNAAPDFEDHPKVIDGCSDLLVQVFGPERGAHCRSAIGAGSLPRQITVEIEMVVSVEDS